MKPCPNGRAAWICEFYLHCAREDLCQHRRCNELTGREPVDNLKDCEGFEPGKRYVDHARRVLSYVDKELTDD